LKHTPEGDGESSGSESTYYVQITEGAKKGENIEMRWNGNVQTMTQRRSSKDSHRIVAKEKTEGGKEAKISIEKKGEESCSNER
jgi:hypothetical protein